MKFRLVEDVISEDSNGGQRTFKLFLACVLKNIIGEIDIDDYHLHHIDGNHMNNEPSNIALMRARDHRSLHSRVRGKDKPDYYDRLMKLYTDEYAVNSTLISNALKDLMTNLTDIIVDNSIQDEQEVNKEN